MTEVPERSGDHAGPGTAGEALSDQNVGLFADVEGRDVLVIAFGGIHDEIGGLPPFEFLGLLGDRPVDKIYVRDQRQAWYQEGVVGLTDSVWETARELRRWTAAHEPKRVVTLGTSAGGFAALLFGSMLDVDRALAFSPQTFISRRLRLVNRDYRWHRQIRSMHRTVPRQNQVYDLRSQLGRGQATTRYEIHVGGQSRMDLRHVNRVRTVPGVDIHVHRGGHTMVKDLRSAGELGPILERLLDPDPPTS